MSTDWQKDVEEFNNEVMQDDHREGIDFPHVPSDKKRAFWKMLINEEMQEILDAIDNENLAEMADGAADSIVVILGLMSSCGIQLQPIWDEVHRTNMLKKGGWKRADGKFMKPGGWQPPEISSVLSQQQVKE